MEFSHEHHDIAEVFKIKGTLSNPHSQELFEMVKQLVESGSKCFIFDLTEVSMMDSSGLGIIILPVKQKCDVKVCLDTANSTVKEVVDLAGVNFRVGYFDNVEKALKASQNA